MALSSELKPCNPKALSPKPPEPYTLNRRGSLEHEGAADVKAERGGLFLGDLRGFERFSVFFFRLWGVKGLGPGVEGFRV